MSEVLRRSKRTKPSVHLSTGLCNIEQTALIGRPTLQASSAIAIRIQAPVAERPVALPPARKGALQMGSIHPFRSVRSFEPDTLQIMGVALDCAWYQLMASGSVLAASWRSEHTREILASRIIARAMVGERDVAHLRDYALAHIDDLVPTAPPLASLNDYAEA